MELKGIYFSADDMQEIQSAFLNIQNALIDNGYISPEISIESVDWSYLPNKIRNLFNQQELNTRKIDAIADWTNPHSAEFEWQESQGNIYPFVNRWYKWVNYNLEIISNKIPKMQQLLDINGDIIYDINNDIIVTIEGFFNEEENVNGNI